MPNSKRSKSRYSRKRISKQRRRSNLKKNTRKKSRGYTPQVKRRTNYRRYSKKGGGNDDEDDEKEIYITRIVNKAVKEGMTSEQANVLRNEMSEPNITVDYLNELETEMSSAHYDLPDWVEDDSREVYPGAGIEKEPTWWTYLLDGLAIATESAGAVAGAVGRVAGAGLSPAKTVAFSALKETPKIILESIPHATFVRDLSKLFVKFGWFGPALAMYEANRWRNHFIDQTSPPVFEVAMKQNRKAVDRSNLESATQQARADYTQRRDDYGTKVWVEPSEEPEDWRAVEKALMAELDKKEDQAKDLKKVGDGDGDYRPAWVSKQKAEDIKNANA